jgi:hypothetical protein
MSLKVAHKSSRHALWLAWWTLSGAACHDGSGPSIELPDATIAGIETDSGPLVRTLRIELPEPFGVEVDYWAAASPRLRVTQTSMATEHSVFLPGLRAGEIYDYEVRTIGPRGTRGAPQRGQLTTDSLPSDLAALRFTALGSPSFRLAMLELRGEPFAGYVIVDQDGAVVWYRRGTAESFTRRANGNFVLLDRNPGLTEIRPDLTVVAELPASGSIEMHHDVIATPDNSLLFLSLDTLTFDGNLWTGDAIWEWRPEEATVVRRWSAWDFLSPATDLGPKSSSGDWLHANSLALGSRGNVIISLPAFNQIVSIAPDFQSLEWRLGGPNASVALDQSGEFWFQHTAAEITPGRVLLFDNGRDRPTGRFSRALELELDLENGSATTAWEFRPQPDIYAPIVGSARRLDNGNTVVDFGTAQGVVDGSGPMSVYEVTPDGWVRWILRIEGADRVNYRATPLDDIAGEVVVRS